MRRALPWCCAGLAAGTAYGVAWQRLSVVELLLVVGGVAVAWVLCAGLVIGAAVVLDRSAPLAVAVVAGALAAFPMSLEWTDGRGRHEGVLPLAEVLRVGAGGDARVVYFDPDTRIWLNDGRAASGP